MVQLPSTNPHIVISDLNSEGDRSINNIRSKYPQIGFIATGLLNQRYEKNIKKLGYDAYIDKTDMVTTMIPTIQKIFDHQQSHVCHQGRVSHSHANGH